MSGSAAPGTRCVAERVVQYTTPGALPAAAHGLLGQDAFSTEAWFEATLLAGLPEGAAGCFQVVSQGEAVSALLAMRRDAGRLSALTTPYTCLWRPLLAPGADPKLVGRALAGLWRRGGIVRLDCLPDDPALAGLFAGLRERGLFVLPFHHFGNWHLDLGGMGWADYVASRPGQLRSAIGRHTNRLMGKEGAIFTLTQNADGLVEAIAAYEHVYARSWKQAEPQPHFNAALMRACAADGTLRLGIIRLGGTPIAAQFWLVHGRWAAVLKLAYDEAARKLAPGNVLTALMIRRLMEQDGVRTIDFGRGDDDYKVQWTGERRQRVGALVVNPLTLSGFTEILKRKGKDFFFTKKKQKTLVRAVAD